MFILKGMKKKLSIIIVSFNTRKLTLECVKSIYANSPSFSFEVIVVDNCSTDGSEKIGSKLKPTWKKNFKLIVNTSNLGFAKANNQGIAKAAGKYILLLNSDTKIKGNTLESLVSFAKAHKDCGIVGPRLLNPDGSLQASVFNLPTLTRAIGQYWLGNAGVLDKYAPKGDTPVVVEALVMAGFLITPGALQRVGKLDERYFMYFEDIEYCRQVKEVGLLVYYLPSAEIIHYHGESGKRNGNQKQYERLVASSKIYHGFLGYYVYSFILWSGQKFLGK